MARTTKAERKRRREAALAKISDGHGFADTAARALDRRQSAHDAGLCMVALVAPQAVISYRLVTDSLSVRMS